MLGEKLQFTQLVLQPTTRCNLNCGYCYLPDRNKNRNMESKVTAKLAKDISNLKLKNCIDILWHAGEPLAIGPSKFLELIESFEPLRNMGMVSHSIQTNATLINDLWCEVFKKYDISVGVSIDGSENLNYKRVFWNQKLAFQNIMSGIECLQRNNIKFSAIAVITEANIDKPKEIFEFFKNLGCISLGINFAETIGSYKASEIQEEIVKKFWAELYECWIADPAFEMRELGTMLSWMDSKISGNNEDDYKIEIIPTIAYNGDICLLSPDFTGVDENIFAQFKINNILMEDLGTILQKGIQAKYVRDFIEGVNSCKSSCPYFDYCKGGQAANKYFELGTTNATETQFCRYLQKIPIDVILDYEG